MTCYSAPMKKLYILQGIPGSGKSTYIQKLVARLAPSRYRVVSADNYFVELGGGTYAFDASKLSDAHSQCFRLFINAVQKGVDVVVVDNTNTSIGEVAPYQLGGQAYGYDVEIVRIQCDPAIAAARNVHGVPPEVVQSLHDRLAAFKAPPWWQVTEVTPFHE